MESNPSSSSSSLKMILQSRPHKTSNFQLRPFLATAVILILCLTRTTVSAQSNSDFESEYDRHCSSTVPRSPSAADRFSPPSASPIILRSGYFRGGAPILNQTLTSGGKILFFRPYSNHMAIVEGLHELSATLHLRESSPEAIGGDFVSPPPDKRRVRFRGHRVRIGRSQLSFQLRGFWSEVSQDVCMVGSGSSLVIGKTRPNSLWVVLKLHYPHNSTILGSLVSGSLESLASSSDSESYFEPISIMSVAQDPSHEYTLLEKDSNSVKNCISRDGDHGEESYRVSALADNGCSVLRRVERFELAYDGDCNNLDCNPIGGFLGFVPKYMFFHRTQCDSKDKKWQMLLGFPNSSSSEYRFPFDPRTALVAEGVWNEKEDRFCGVGCRILNFSESFDNAYVGDCSTGFSLRFPASLSLRKRDNLVGKIWSNRGANGSGHSGEIGFSDLNKGLMISSGAKYEYTVIDTLRKTCKMSTVARGKGKKYPNEYSSDMMFDMSVKNSKGLNAMGFSKPFVVGNQVNKNQNFGFPGVYPQVMTEVPTMPSVTHNSLVNISYEISFSVPTGFKFTPDNFQSDEVKISAEGTYNKDNGVLCMIGCRDLSSKTLHLATNDTLDCEIAINVQFSPLDAKTSKDVKGTIESTRKSSDPLYFDRLELSSNSIYFGQAEYSIWRMDLEITMVLISNTLTCVFVGFQLFYTKSHPELRPFASVAMLIVLTVAHMIPLVLNFEAMFVSHRSPQNNLLGSGGWLEANEVIVRIVTMVAFLLQLRLLQVTWSSRKDEAIETSLWSCERKVLYVTVPLYVLGALVTWFVNHLKNNTGIRIRAVRNPRFQRQSLQQHSLWKDLKAYAGLVMDGFLLPQILFNLFAGSGEKALAPLFYTGTTLVRLMPHAYDLFRDRAYTSYMDWSYIYASRRMDFFSTAWDIVIPLGGLLFAVLIFLQQRFGGRCILPRRVRESCGYEKVPAIGNEDL